MRFEVVSQQGSQKLPTTTAYPLLDNQLIIFLRAWGSQDYNQKFVDEVSHFLSTAQADIEITSPFDYMDNLSSLTNKVRISLLLAHDYFYKAENKNSYSVGFETAILMKNKSEIAWGAVGRFDLTLAHENYTQVVSAESTTWDSQVLLPPQLLGAERDLLFRCGSLVLKKEELFVSTVYGQSTNWVKNDTQTWDFSSAATQDTMPNSAGGSYWVSKIKSE